MSGLRAGNRYALRSRRGRCSSCEREPAELHTTGLSSRRAGTRGSGAELSRSTRCRTRYWSSGAECGIADGCCDRSDAVRDRCSHGGSTVGHGSDSRAG